MSLQRKRIVEIEDCAGQQVVVSTKDWVYIGKLEVITSGELIINVGDLLLTVNREDVDNVLVK
ncbi:hypothetical protein [Halobacillus mangrovi]|uniref:Uncharacterized protein n=1 Tax=Halobacillus mangrovi TaxID=402384 RepID=A0A1W5ZTR3_9BACI|nr:hypothetical protein [Halobacillus mangrovi]ARI76704.1 hypothetical protein HM131_07540 [Halobacillus mangrovi]